MNCPPSPWIPRFCQIRLSLILFAVFCLGPLVAAQQSNRADAITGRVLGDDGQPLVNVGVGAQEVESRGPNRIYRNATTDDEGYFRLTRLPPGRYAIGVSAEGYLNASPNAIERSTQPGDRYFQPGASVTITMKKGGVITGRVSNTEDQAVVSVTVVLEYVRDEFDRTIKGAWIEKEEWTDDRGVYRFYGLRPGSYLVRAGGRERQVSGVTAFDSDAPTYYPSAKRETASEIKVRAGEEATGIDIRYLGERGYAIRGMISGAINIRRLPYLKLTRLPGGAQVGFVYARAEEGSIKFDFEGIAEGDYDLIAVRESDDDDDGAASSLRRVTINDADLNNVELRLIPFSSLAGSIVMAADSPTCQIQQRRPVSAVSLALQRDDAAQSEPTQVRTGPQAEFATRRIEAGRYRLIARLPHIEWYLRAISLPGQVPAQKSVDIARQGLTLQPGQRATGLIVTVAEGAALLGGRMVSAADGVPLPARVRLHLVPAEPASADEMLRYYETDMRIDGGFFFSNLAPGRYWILARPVPEDESSQQPARPVAWDAASRGKLWREARAVKTEVALQPCQQITNHILRYSK